MEKYSIKARTYPVLLFILPIVVVALVFSLQFKTYMQMGISIGITSALAFLFSQLGRDAGKRKEKKLWESWGGNPTIQLLRWSNTEIDIITKQRYHDVLSKMCPEKKNKGSHGLQNLDPYFLNEIYLSWIKYLITHTRDINQFPLLFKENVNYGFRRNLWGMKLQALSLIILIMLGLFMFHKLEHPNMPLTSPFIVAEVLLLLFLLFWLIVIRKDWVRVPAFAYAHRLLEAVDVINK